MNTITYVPYPSFTRSVTVLSDQHLNIVREGSLQVIYQLCWIDQLTSQPQAEVARWIGHAGALIHYAQATDEEWRRRRGCDIRLVRDWLDSYSLRFPDQWSTPEWFGDIAFHKSERDLLRTMDPIFYVNLSEKTTAK